MLNKRAAFAVIVSVSCDLALRIDQHVAAADHARANNESPRIP